MARWPAAIWQPGAPQGGALRPIAVTMHHQAGSGNPLGTYQRNNVSAHFWLPKSGQPVQHVDTAVRAYHGVNHNGFGLGVETEGCGAPPHAEALTAHQLECFADLMRWANATHGIPLRLSERIDEPGLNYHRCQGGPATACPCDVRLNMRPAILGAAGGPGAPSVPPPVQSAPPASGGAAPPYPGRPLVATMRGGGSATWQAQMAARGWGLAVDDVYGPDSSSVATRFQREKGLIVDGVVGPETWRATWEAPVT
jgi:hypothetical protein